MNLCNISMLYVISWGIVSIECHMCKAGSRLVDAGTIISALKFYLGCSNVGSMHVVCASYTHARVCICSQLQLGD